MTRTTLAVFVLISLWAADAAFVLYMLHYRPACAQGDVLVPRGERPMSGYRCLTVSPSR